MAAATAIAVHLSVAGAPTGLLLAGSRVATLLDAPGVAWRLLQRAADGHAGGGHGTVKALVSLAEAYRLEGRHAEAIAHLEEARLLVERLAGSRGPEVAPVLDRLATASFERGEYAEADAFQHRALMIRTAAYGVDAPSVVTSLEDIADSKRTRGQLDEAMQLARRVLAMREQEAEPRSADLARALGRIGAIYRQDESLGLAELYLQRALDLVEPATRTATLAEGDRKQRALAGEAARIFAEAGALRLEQGLHGDARRLLSRSFRLADARRDAPATQAQVLSLMAETYRREGRGLQALAHLRIALRFAEEMPRTPAARARILEELRRLKSEMGIAAPGIHEAARAESGPAGARHRFGAGVLDPAHFYRVLSGRDQRSSTDLSYLS